MCVSLYPHVFFFSFKAGVCMCVCVREREAVGVLMCVDVYLSEQLFQRERISASVIASAIFSSRYLSLSVSLSHFSLVSIFSLNFVLCPPADFLFSSHSSFFSLFIFPPFLSP